MLTKSEIKKEKIILLLVLLLSSIFVIGCNSHGKSDEEDIRYEFCPGKYFSSSSQSDKMMYYAVNQSTILGSAVYDSTDNVIRGSAFLSPVNISDDNNGMWVADGFYRDVNNNYSIGTYTLSFNLKSGTYSTKREMSWDNIPNWKDTPVFDISQVNNSSHQIIVTHKGIINSDSTNEYEVRYRIKVYVKLISSSQLFGQCAAQKNVGVLIYSLPKVPNSIELVPVLVAEMYQGGKIQKVLFYPGESFVYNP